MPGEVSALQAYGRARDPRQNAGCGKAQEPSKTRRPRKTEAGKRRLAERAPWGVGCKAERGKPQP